MRRLRSFLALLAVVGGNAACGKTAEEPPPIVWHHDVESGRAAAIAQNKLAIIFFHADWDCGSKEYEHTTFVDPQVRALLHKDFVAIEVDVSDEEQTETRRLSERFGIIGVPTLVILGPDLAREEGRANQYLDGRSLAGLLVSAKENAEHRQFRSLASAH